MVEAGSLLSGCCGWFCFTDVCKRHVVPVAQWIAHQTSDLGVGGSSPPWDFGFFGSYS
jgi:hypothetical protein